ncbi:hypothetical protein M7I_0833 [Glarea lozoyensis 74030]|uniref:Uncharacterized protein n=1 Tax=Glarea lozoyensis (strain ATCC 74030 / MF5533) TaxID=1104152 RepID=H0EEF8_GLAL7|nr:hypothetical protein M7I_0833 [Glarea lozoyensis 74030]
MRDEDASEVAKKKHCREISSLRLMTGEPYKHRLKEFQFSQDIHVEIDKIGNPQN